MEWPWNRKALSERYNLSCAFTVDLRCPINKNVSYGANWKKQCEYVLWRIMVSSETNQNNRKRNVPLNIGHWYLPWKLILFLKTCKAIYRWAKDASKSDIEWPRKVVCQNLDGKAGRLSWFLRPSWVILWIADKPDQHKYLDSNGSVVFIHLLCRCYCL